MRRFFLLSLLFGLFLAAVPAMISRTEETAGAQAEGFTQTAAAPAGGEETIAVFLPEENKTEDVPVQDYLLGVVAAEMPAEYEPEALKAQALAALSYARHTLQSKDAVAADSATAQGFWSEEEMRQSWGENYETNRQKILEAIREVSGLSLEYDGAPILAAYFAVSGGRTENASDVWGGDYPYLTSVTSDGDALSAGLTSTKAVEKDAAFSALCEIRPPEDKAMTIGVTERTEGGAVKKITLGETSYTGAEVRAALALSSANFTVQEEEDHLLFTVTGKGHGVGMSQYGADYMARQGASFAEILLHYYPGAVIVQKNAEPA